MSLTLGFLPRGLTLHEGDALRFDFAALAATRGRKLRVVGNLPYNVSSPILFKLLRAADELHHYSCISDGTWAELAKRYDTLQLMDVVFAVGQYHLVSMALNSFGVQLDAGVKGF